MKKYYKVVWNDDCRLMSICQDPLFPHNLKVEYKIGEWAKPVLQGSRLFVFNSFENAYRFCMRPDNKRQIYECEIQGNVGVPQYIPAISCIKEFWHRKLQKRSIDKSWFTTQHVPYGTRTASAVKLTKRVHIS